MQAQDLPLGFGLALANWPLASVFFCAFLVALLSYRHGPQEARMTALNWVFAIRVYYNLVAGANHTFVNLVPDYPDRAADPLAAAIWLSAINVCLLALLAFTHWRGLRR